MAQHGKRYDFLSVLTIPRSLDFVWCKFPLEELPKAPGPKFRPALVRAIKLSPDQTMAAVEVTFGTSKLKDGEGRLDLIIQNSASLDECGLPCATRFDLDKTIWLPWASEYFEPRDGYRSPVIGSLDQMSRTQLEVLKIQRRGH